MNSTRGAASGEAWFAPLRGLAVNGPASVVAPSNQPVESRRDDGTLWRRHWVDGERLVIDFVGAAMAEVVDGTVWFDRALDEQMSEHLVLDHVLPLWLANEGRLVVHAALVARDDVGAALIGRSGAGKSTLTTFLGGNGWRVGGDDGIVISPGPPTTAEATYPSIRLTDQSVELLDTRDATPIAGKSRLSLSAFDVIANEVGLAVLVFVEPEAGSVSSVSGLGSAATHAKLFGATFHADLDPDGNLAAVFDQLGTVVEGTTAVSLRVGRGVDGLESARFLLDGLVDEG